MQFRKKPIVIEAIQWTGKKIIVPPGPEWFLKAEQSDVIELAGDQLWIKTLEGPMTAQIGDWIIRGVNGEIYPCKPDIFEKTYESITGATPPESVGNQTAVNVQKAEQNYAEYKQQSSCEPGASNMDFESIRMKFAAISVASNANTRESAKTHRIDRDNPYWSQAYDDVCRAVDREMSLLEELELTQRLLKSESALKQAAIDQVESLTKRMSQIRQLT